MMCIKIFSSECKTEERFCDCALPVVRLSYFRLQMSLDKDFFENLYRSEMVTQL